ncbi:hypothetical protein BC332_21271 [Capsicum chinense]|nr:hypothetical protein BC332_21271 [Capsicum chinense]
MNRIGVPHGEMLGLMNLLSMRSFNYSFNSLSSARVILYYRIDIGCVSGRRSILKLISLLGGTPGRSSGNTYGNSLTTKIDLRVGASKIKSLTHTRPLVAWNRHLAESGEELTTDGTGPIGIHPYLSEKIPENSEFDGLA